MTGPSRRCAGVPWGGRCWATRWAMPAPRRRIGGRGAWVRHPRFAIGEPAVAPLLISVVGLRSSGPPLPCVGFPGPEFRGAWFRGVVDGCVPESVEKSGWRGLISSPGVVYSRMLPPGKEGYGREFAGRSASPSLCPCWCRSHRPEFFGVRSGWGRWNSLSVTVGRAVRTDGSDGGRRTSPGGGGIRARPRPRTWRHVRSRPVVGRAPGAVLTGRVEVLLLLDGGAAPALGDGQAVDQPSGGGRRTVRRPGVVAGVFPRASALGGFRGAEGPSGQVIVRVR